MTKEEAQWRAKRTQQLLESGLERFDALAQVRQEARAQPWMREVMHKMVATMRATAPQLPEAAPHPPADTILARFLRTD